MPEQLVQRYRQMPDEQLLQIATSEADGLTPEALSVLHAELDRRGAAPALHRVVDAQTRELSRHDVNRLVASVQKQTCPECDRDDRPLNGGVIAVAKSFILFTVYDQETIIACPDCLAVRAKRSAWITAILGWWGFPFGPIQTVKALRHNRRTIRQRERDSPSDALHAFATQHPGVVTAIAIAGE
ncbi:MAG: hypothetical protein Rubg2KO_27060 [Rubricoccaceae bacterium]